LESASVRIPSRPGLRLSVSSQMCTTAACTSAHPR
jgi:hypothetical protein